MKGRCERKQSASMRRFCQTVKTRKVRSKWRLLEWAHVQETPGSVAAAVYVHAEPARRRSTELVPDVWEADVAAEVSAADLDRGMGLSHARQDVQVLLAVRDDHVPAGRAGGRTGHRCGADWPEGGWMPV